MNNMFRVAVMLSAVDRMSSVVNTAVNRSIGDLRKLKEAQPILEGAAMVGAGLQGMKFLEGPVKEFARFEKDAARLKANVMTDGGILDPKTWKGLDALSVSLGNDLPGDTADMTRMFTVMKQGGLDAKDIINGVGAATAKLSVALGEDYSYTADIVTSLKNASGVAAQDMEKYLDVIARTRNMKVPLEDMKNAFAKSAGSLKFLGLQGLESSKSMSAFFAMFIRDGNTGETVGTNFSRVLGEITNPKKYKDFQVAAKAAIGSTLDLLDKKGNFMGIENMIGQFDKLKGLDVKTIAGILAPLTGAEGMDDKMLKTLSKGGKQGYNDMLKGMFSQATLSEKVKVQLQTLDAKFEETQGTWANTKAAFGASLAPLLMAFMTKMNAVLQTIQEFIAQHPKIAMFVGTFIAIFSAALMLAGVVKIVRGIIAVFRLLNITMMANPFILIAVLAIAAISLIITYWSEISNFFKGLFDKVGKIFSGAFAAMKIIVLNFTPVGLIYNHWGKIGSFFKGVLNSVVSFFKKWGKDIATLLLGPFAPAVMIFRHWDKVGPYFQKVLDMIKGVFKAVIAHIFGIGKEFFNAGKNIVMSIVNGISNAAYKLTDKIKSIVKDVRDFFPFSPAKTGPLRDIHKIRLIETIADSINPKSLISKMHGVSQTLFNFQPNAPIPSHGFGSGSQSAPVTIHFSPVYHAAPGSSFAADKATFLEEMKKYKKQMFDEFMSEMARRERKQY